MAVAKVTEIVDVAIAEDAVINAELINAELRMQNLGNPGNADL